MHAPAPSHDPTAARQAWALALGLALLYFGAQVLTRLAASPALELDEAEQALWTQSWAWGHGPQPPLYTWLQQLVFLLTGPSLLGLSLLKNLLLATTYLALWRAGLKLMPAPLAATTALMPLLMLQIGWESQRDLTHSVLVTTVAALTVLASLRLLEAQQRLGRWALLGLLVGAGLLSKYSYAGFALAWFAALAWLPAGRAALRQPGAWAGLLLAAGLAGAVLAPHGLWLLDHGEAARAHAAGKLAGAAAPDALARLLGMGRGLLGALLAAVAGLMPLGLVLLLVLGPRGLRSAWQAPVAEATARSQRALARALGGRYLLTMALFFAALVILGGATQFKERWLMPFLLPLPLLFFASLPALQGHPRRRWLHRLAALAAVIWLAGIGLRTWVAGERNRPDELNEPLAALVQGLHAAGAVPAGPFTLISSDRVLAGGLRLALPQARVEVRRPDEPPAALPAGPLLWVGRGADVKAASAALPQGLPPRQHWTLPVHPRGPGRVSYAAAWRDAGAGPGP